MSRSIEYAVGRRRIIAAIALTTSLAATTLCAGAATCTNGRVSIVPMPLPSAAFHTFMQAAPGTKIYSYDIVTVTNGKSSRDFIPTSRITCDAAGIYFTANASHAQFPVTATVTSHSLRTWAIFPGLPPTGDEIAQLRLGRTRLVRTVTAASAAAAEAATPSPAPSPSPSPKPKKHFL